MPGVTKRTWKDARGRKQTRFDATLRAPDGTERSATFERAEDAEAWLDSQKTDRRRGTWIDPRAARTPFREWAELWGATTHHLRASSRLRAEGVLERHLLPRFGSMQLASIRTIDVQAFVSELTAAGLAPGSVRRIYAVLRSILRSAEVSNMIGRSPCTGVSIPAAKLQQQRFLTVEEIELLAGAVDGHRALVLLGAYGGLRWAEMVGLRMDRVDFLRSRVRVEEALVEVAGRFHAGPTKGGRARVVTLPRFVTEDMAAHVATTQPGTDGLLFTDARRGPLRHSNFRRRVWLPALESSGIARPWPRIHDLRHTAASLAIAAGAHPKAIQERLGHASITTTLNVYGHLLPSLDEALAVRLEEMKDSLGAIAQRS